MIQSTVFVTQHPLTCTWSSQRVPAPVARTYTFGALAFMSISTLTCRQSSANTALTTAGVVQRSSAVVTPPLHCSSSTRSDPVRVAPLAQNEMLYCAAGLMRGPWPASANDVLNGNNSGVAVGTVTRSDERPCFGSRVSSSITDRPSRSLVE